MADRLGTLFRGGFYASGGDEEAHQREMRSTIARRCSIPVENATGNSRDESGLSLSFSLPLSFSLFLLVLAMQIDENARLTRRKSPRTQRAQTRREGQCQVSRDSRRDG